MQNFTYLELSTTAECWKILTWLIIPAPTFHTVMSCEAVAINFVIPPHRVYLGINLLRLNHATIWWANLPLYHDIMLTWNVVTVKLRTPEVVNNYCSISTIIGRRPRVRPVGAGPNDRCSHVSISNACTYTWCNHRIVHSIETGENYYVSNDSKYVKSFWHMYMCTTFNNQTLCR